MASKFFTWTKGDRRAAAEVHRTGGLFPIVTDFSHPRDSPHATGAQNAPQLAAARQPPLALPAISYHDAHGACMAPASALHNAALSSVSSASNLLAVVNEMLRSPALAASPYPRSPLHKPLPGRPRSISLPPTPDIAELPGSLLQENQGFPPASPVATQTMRSVRSGNLLSPTLAEYRAPPPPSELRAGVPLHKKSLSDARVQRRSKSRPSLIPSPRTTTESKLTACSASTNGGETSGNDSARARAGSDSSRSLQPSPMIVERRNGKKLSNHAPSRHGEMSTRSSQVEELKSTITAQDQTISTLSAQFASLQTSHEAHIASLSEAHAKEISTLKTYARVLEEQSQQKSLHHASSNHHLLMLLDTAEPQTPTTPRAQIAPSANSVRSFSTALEEQPGSTPERNADMHKLTRSFSGARRPRPQAQLFTDDELHKQNREVMLQNEQYKQNHEAFQKQIGSLMDKLRDATTDKKDIQKNLDRMASHCAAQDELIGTLKKEARDLEKHDTSDLKRALENVTKLRNSVDYLESRLEASNVARVDALEEIYNLQHDVSPFSRAQPSEKQLRIDLQDTTLKVFALEKQLKRHGIPASDGPQPRNKSENDVQTADPNQVKAISAFVSKIERLAEEKEEVIKICERDLAENTAAADQRADEAERLRAESQMLWQKECDHWENKHNRSAAEVKELKSKLDDAEIQVLRLRREMELFKTALEAEVRKHGSFKIWGDIDTDSLLPNATREDVDRMIARLQKRLKAHMATHSTTTEKPLTDGELRIEQLSKEVEFYVKEIVYYKLDIKGYKKDIKKLSAALNVPSSASSPTISGHRDTTPAAPRQKFALMSPALAISATPSPTSIPMSASSSLQSTGTLATSAVFSSPQASPARSTHTAINTNLNKKLPPSPIPATPQTPERSARRPSASSATNSSPLTAIRSPPPTTTASAAADTEAETEAAQVPAPLFHLQRGDTQRSASDSIITMYASARTPDWTPPRSTPERPVRPRYGLGEGPRVDVLAAAEASHPLSTPASNPASTAAEEVGQRKEQGKVEVGTGTETGSGMGSAKMPIRGHGRSISYSTAAGHVQPQGRKRSGSGSGSVGANEGSSIPFVIGMGSPHNPALLGANGNGKPF